MAEKPILFNTEMVRAILDGRKTQTRRICKGQPQDGVTSPELMGYKPPFSVGDILWVRETWKQATTGTAGPGLIDLYLYRADEPQDTTGMMVEDRWHPSIHMPRMAARLFLKVTDVRIERLRECSNGWCTDIEAEGVKAPQNPVLYIDDDAYHDALRESMQKLWDSTVRKDDLKRYGWEANPWVWVIEFERVEKPW